MLLSKLQLQQSNHLQLMHHPSAGSLQTSHMLFAVLSISHFFLGTERVPSSTIMVAIPANLQAGEAISTNMCLRQRSIQGTIMDIEAPVTGIPMGMENGAATGNPGQLVFLPDLPSTVQLWHNQRLIMLAWLLSSLISLVLCAPLFMASGLFLAAEIAAVMGIIASLVQLCEKELASSNSKCHKLPRLWPAVPGAMHEVGMFTSASRHGWV
jgi:hypothetical protein